MLAILSDDQAAEVSEPGQDAFDQPVAAIAAQRPTILALVLCGSTDAGWSAIVGRLLAIVPQESEARRTADVRLKSTVLEREPSMNSHPNSLRGVNSLKITIFIGWGNAGRCFSRPMAVEDASRFRLLWNGGFSPNRWLPRKPGPVLYRPGMEKLRKIDLV